MLIISILLYISISIFGMRAESLGHQGLADASVFGLFICAAIAFYAMMPLLVI